MTGAINYVRREGRYVMKYYLVADISIWRRPSDIQQQLQTWRKRTIAGRPKAALLFWFFGDFRCGALLFMVIHVIYKYKNK